MSPRVDKQRSCQKNPVLIKTRRGCDTDTLVAEFPSITLVSFFRETPVPLSNIGLSGPQMFMVSRTFLDKMRIFMRTGENVRHVKELVQRTRQEHTEWCDLYKMFVLTGAF